MIYTNKSSYPTTAHTVTDDPNSSATAGRAEAVPYTLHTMSVSNEEAQVVAPKSIGEEKRWNLKAWLFGLGTIVTLAIVVTSVLLPRTKLLRTKDEQQYFASLAPSPAPTNAGAAECLNKRIRITEVCNAPGLDDKLVELKVLVNDQHYWPKVESDCLDGYGSDGITCVVPNSSLSGCFKLLNSIELPFVPTPHGAGLGDIKVTIVDEDFLWDDIVEIFAPKQEWYRPNLCERKEIEFAEHSYGESSKIKMVVDWGEVQNRCVEESALLTGLNDVATALESVQLGLLEYSKGIDGRGRQRRLIFPLLATGFRVMAGAVSAGGRSFVNLFTRQTRLGNALSTTSDMAEIGSFLLSLVGDEGDGSPPRSNDDSVFFGEVFERFARIDSQLDNIQVQIRDGFEEIKLVIEREFAEQELDMWVNQWLRIKLRGDYSAFTNRLNTESSRSRYSEIFRQTCSGDHSPYIIFQVLYSHSCDACMKFSGKSQQHFLDTYVDLANANFDDVMDRVLWFRRSFGTVVIGALTEAIYFYSVCLYRSKDDACDEIDPVRDARLEEMGYALEEVVTSLGEAETRLE